MGKKGNKQIAEEIQEPEVDEHWDALARYLAAHEINLEKLETRLFLTSRLFHFDQVADQWPKDAAVKLFKASASATFSGVELYTVCWLAYRQMQAMKGSRRSTDARHAETRAMRDEVFKWCNANMSEYPSMDNAAEAVAGKVVPVKFRTARKWIGEWRKMHSARKV